MKDEERVRAFVLEQHGKTLEDVSVDVSSVLGAFEAMGMSFSYAKLVCSAISEMQDRDKYIFNAEKH